MGPLRPACHLAACWLLTLLWRGHATAAGAIKLDNYTFDKMLAVPGLSVAVKFDEAYAYGEKEDAFKEVAQLAYRVPNFLMAEVPVQDYGDMINDDLRNRFGLSTDDFPVYYLFLDGGKVQRRFEAFPDPNARRPPTWDDEEDGVWQAPVLEELNTANLLLWLRRNGIKMPSLGTIHELDQLVQKFMKADDKASVLKETDAAVLSDHPNDRKSAMYTKIMQKVIDKGPQYVAAETTRVRNLMAGKISEEKHAELADKVKILGVFAAEV